MRRYIRTLLDNADAAGELIVYFFGHGVEQGRHRLLVPQDYDLAAPIPASQMISDNDLFAWARVPKAGSVLIMIDACREGVSLTLGPEDDGSKSPAITEITGIVAKLANVPTVAIIYSCRQDQKSHPEPDKTCSAFTKALAETLEAEDNHATPAEIVPALQARFDIYLRSRQTVTLDERRIKGRRGTPEQLIIKESFAARFRSRLASSQCVRKLQSTMLWRKASEEAGIGAQISAIVLRAEERVAAAQRALPEQRWRIDDAPFRVIARVEKLLAATSLRSSRPSVSSAEGAVLLATPFIYETVLAAAETTLAAVGPVLDPLSIPGSADGIPFWRAWGVACLNDELARHRYQTIVEQGYTEAVSDFAGWCFNIFCHTAGELWDPHAGGNERIGWASRSGQ